MPDDTRNVLQNGWLHTGERARMDEDGFFTIVDRKKDLILSGAYNVYPRDVEEVLYEHPKVLEVAVVSMRKALHTPDADGDSSQNDASPFFNPLFVLKRHATATSDELLALSRVRLL